MKRLLLGTLGGLALLLLTGCPIILLSALSPDLMITLGRFDPTANNDLFAGETGSLFIPVTITDQTGRAVTGAFDVTFTLSDGVVTEATTVSVTAGSEQIVEWAALPATIVAGAYTLTAALVVPDGIEDAADNNNTAAVNVQIGATTTPDLTVTVTVPGGGIYPAGGTFSVVWQVNNLGFGEVASGTEFEIDFSITLSGNPTSLGTATVTLTEPLYPAVDSIQGTVPLTMAAAADLALDNGEPTLTEWNGDLTATVDAGTAVTEADETNNSNPPGSMTITSRSALPDLSVQTVSFSSPAVVQGKPVAAWVVVENIGGAVAPAATYSVVLYVDLNDDTLRDAGEDLHEFAMAGTPAIPYDDIGSANTALFPVPADVVFPDTITYDRSSHELRAEIVADAAMNEWYPWNNDGGTGTTYELLPASYDLEPGLLVLNSHVIADGEDILGTLTIKNNGDDELDSSITVELYGSPDRTLTPGGDVLLGSQVLAVVQIAANGVADFAIDLTSIDTVDINEVGYIYALVDTLDDVWEIDETNNGHLDVELAQPAPTPAALIWDDDNPPGSYDLRVILFRPTADVALGDTAFDGGEVYDSAGVLVDSLGFSGFGNYTVTTLTPGTYYLRVAGTGGAASDSGPYGIILTGQSNMTYAYFPSALSTNVADLAESDDASTGNVPDNPVSLLPGVQHNRFLGYLEVDWFTFTLP